MLLEITPVVKSEDVHEVVGRIQQKAQQILAKELNIDAKATVGFAMTLSEVCQNIVEHAGRGGGHLRRERDGRQQGPGGPGRAGPPALHQQAGNQRALQQK